MTPFVINTGLTPTDEQYHNLVEDVLHNGNFKGDRTGTGTYAVVGRMARYSLLNQRSPRLTTKGMQDTAEREMLWFCSGSSSIKELRDQKIGIWNSWLIPGTAKYRHKTTVELINAIAKKFDADTGTAHYVDAPTFAQVPSGRGVNVFGKCLVKITLKADMKKTVDVYGSVTDFTDIESVIDDVATQLGIELTFLVDGDIGPGGYGPQWRHWKDTQVISMAEYDAYAAQGYHAIGETFGREMKHHGELAGKLVVHREIDQLQNAINLLRNDPNSRRIIVSAWNPALTWKAALPPCHLYFQFISHELTLEQRYMIARDRVALQKYDLKKEADKGFMDMALRTWMAYDLEADRRDCTDEELHGNMDAVGIKRRGLYCFLLLRSNDLGLGQPFNVAQYATLTHMVAQCVDMAPLELVWAAVDAHVYTNHVKALEHQLTLQSKECIPRLKLNPAIKEIDGFKISDLTIHDYDSHPALTKDMPVAV